MSGSYQKQQHRSTIKVSVTISAGTEWRTACSMFSDLELHQSPFGQWFVKVLDTGERMEEVLFLHSGWGKIAAAASTQYIIDRWSPDILINLGTCGGFAGEIERGTIILVEKVIVYDIINQIGDQKAAIDRYTTDIDLSWLKGDYPHDVHRTLMVSGDRDICPEDIPNLKAQFGAKAGDWESGAIAWVAARNNIRCLILRGVSDLVDCKGGEAYDGNIHVFRENTDRIMRKLIHHLSKWIALCNVSST